MSRARRGDQGAFAELYALHAPSLYALALKLLGNPATAEDVVQDTFIKAIQSIGGFRGDAPLRAWLKRVTAHLAIDHLRARRPVAEVDPDFMVATDAGPEHLSEALGLLARLPATARSVVWLHEMEGWSHPEIAARFGYTESWSKSLLSRSLSRLRSWMEESG